MKNIAILGFGVVGSGVYDIIKNNEKLSQSTNICKILVRDIEKYKGLHPELPFVNNVNEINFEEIDIVIEVMGGVSKTFEILKDAIVKNTHVITANKDLISTKYEFLYNLAAENNVSINFEASVAGSVPIINLLNTNFKSDEVDEIYGILNGTTNFILSKMKFEGLSYQSALKLAQENGFAEADPSSDVLGYDAARKIAILSTICYQKNIKFEDVLCNGITSIDERIINFANENNYIVKLIGKSKYADGKVSIEVAPKLISKENVISQVHNENNIVVLNTKNTGKQYFIGAGAGKLPTANSIVSDLNNVLFNNISNEQVFGEALFETTKNSNVAFVENGEVVVKKLGVDFKNFNEVYEIID